MGLLTRLREWFAGLLGGSGASDSDDTSGPAPEAVEDDGSAEGSGDGDGNEGLDPTAVTEKRSDATDDTVDALRNVRESEGPETDTDGDGVDRDGTDGNRSGTDGPEPDASVDDAKD